MLSLARRAMAQFAIQWLCSAELVLDLAAMAAGLVSSLEVLIGLMHAVWRPCLPLVL